MSRQQDDTLNTTFDPQCYSIDSHLRDNRAVNSRRSLSYVSAIGASLSVTPPSLSFDDKFDCFMRGRRATGATGDLMV